MDIGIYVVTHKKFEKPIDDIYIPILAGAFEHDTDDFAGYELDNKGDNISAKHDLYSEFTVIYWIWKNSNYSIVGDNHYRRYFISGSWGRYIKCMFSKGDVKKYCLGSEEIRKIFNEGYNCILPKKMCHYERNMYTLYCGVRDDGKILFENIRNIILRICPEYMDAYEKMLKMRVSYFKCIHIMGKEQFDKMAEWLFSIYNELEKIDMDYKEREFAFLGEWLINTWVIQNKKTGFLKVKELFFVNTECTPGKNNYSRFDTIWPRWIDFINSVTFRLALRIIKRIMRKKG